MTWFYAGALLVIALAVADGALSGLAWAALELALLVAVTAAASVLRPHAEPYVRKLADLSPEDLPWAAHAVVLAILWGLLIGLLILAHPMSRRWRFRADRWLGAGLALVTGTVAALVLCSFAVWSTPRPYERELAGSPLCGALVRANDAGLGALFPERLPARLAQIQHP